MKVKLELHRQRFVIASEILGPVHCRGVVVQIQQLPETSSLGLVGHPQAGTHVQERVSVITNGIDFIERDRSNAILADFDLVGTAQVEWVLLFFSFYFFLLFLAVRLYKEIYKTRFVDHFIHNRLVQYDAFVQI